MSICIVCVYIYMYVIYLYIYMHTCLYVLFVFISVCMSEFMAVWKPWVLKEFRASGSAGFRFKALVWGGWLGSHTLAASFCLTLARKQVFNV